MSLVKLLSIDGGGIRGLAALVVLEQLMAVANEERRQNGLPSQEPWEMFDLIGGTSTGGLIAVMLGRLRMSLQECKEAYRTLSRQAFSPNNFITRTVQFASLGPKFKTKPIEDAIKDVIEGARGRLLVGPEEALLREDDAACKVFVVSHLENIAGRAAIFRSYRNFQRPNETFDTMTIWQACRGTSAATTFFEQLKIGEDVFSDGGLLCNNPVSLVHIEASEMFRGRETLLISLGTGIATDKAYNPNILTVASVLADLATRTQAQADEFFRRDGAEKSRSKRYFRFDIPGIGDVAMDEADKLNDIKLASEKYLDDPEVGMKVRTCSEQLAEGEMRLPEAPGIEPAQNNEEDLQGLDSAAHQVFVEVYRGFAAYAENPREAAIPSPHEENFRWLWTETDHGFIHWLQSEDTAYWISGLPGSGKSTLMKFIVKNSLTRQYLGIDTESEGLNVLFAYFFSEMSELPTKQEKSIEGLLHALVKLFLDCDARLARVVMNVYNTKVLRHYVAATTPPMWPIACLKEVLMEISRQEVVRGKICLFVDGLDECEGKRGPHLKFLLSWIESMRGGTLQVRLCLAARDTEELGDQLIGYPRLEVNRWTDKDIRGYVHDKLNDALGRSISLNTSSYDMTNSCLIQNIVSMAQGVFLWVKLVVADLVSDLEDGKEEAALQLRLNTLPPELESLYSHIIEEIPHKDLATAYKFFRLLLRAPGQTCSLTLLQFLLAAQNPFDAITCEVKYDASKKCEAYMLEKMSLVKHRVRSRCRNLVQIRTRNQAEARWGPLRRENVTFIHLTLKEHLNKPEVKQKIEDRIASTGGEIIPEVDTLLMASYLRLIKTQAFCIPHWANGTKQFQQGGIESGSNDNQLQSVEPPRSFFEGEDQFDEDEYNEEICWRTADNCITKFLNYAQNLEFSLKSPQIEYIDELNNVLLQVDEDWASKFYFHKTSENIPEVNILCLAICCKLQLFVEQKLTSQMAKKRRNPPLLFYAMNPPGWAYEPVDLQMLKILIKAGVRVNDTYIHNKNEQTIWGHTLDHYLSLGTNHPMDNWVEVVQLMLESGADANQKVSLRGGKYSTALHLLLNQYPKVSASQKREVKCGIELLLKHGADPQLENSDGINVVDHARKAKGQSLNIVQKAAGLESRRSQSIGAAMNTRSAAVVPPATNVPKIGSTSHHFTVGGNGKGVSSKAQRQSSKRRQSNAEMQGQTEDHQAPKRRRQRSQNKRGRV